VGRAQRSSVIQKRQLIFNALLDSGKPLSAYEIHKATGIRKDSLHYHLKSMVKSGILVPYDSKYALQKLYYDPRAKQSLDVAIELIVSILASQSVWDYVDRGKEDEFSVVASNLEYYIRSLKEPAQM